MADNAIYTPTPRTIDVTVYRDAGTGEIKADSGPAHLVAEKGEVIGRETARVTWRGSLLKNGVERWFGVVLADGSTHAVIGEGS